MTKTEAEELAEGISRLGEHLWPPLIRALNGRYKQWRWSWGSKHLSGAGIELWIEVERRKRG